VPDVTDEHELSDVVICLTTTPCHLGDVRHWFECNGVRCRRRGAKLYLHPRNPVFLCRHCHDLTYKSQRADRATRLLMKAGKIRARLGGRRDYRHPFPPKPKGMHWKTYNRLRAEAEELTSMGSWLQYRSLK